ALISCICVNNTSIVELLGCFLIQSRGPTRAGRTFSRRKANVEACGMHFRWRTLGRCSAPGTSPCPVAVRQGAAETQTPAGLCSAVPAPARCRHRLQTQKSPPLGRALVVSVKFFPTEILRWFSESL